MPQCMTDWPREGEDPRLKALVMSDGVASCGEFVESLWGH